MRARGTSTVSLEVSSLLTAAVLTRRVKPGKKNEGGGTQAKVLSRNQAGIQASRQELYGEQKKRKEAG
jgi:hypothetical protein